MTPCRVRACAATGISRASLPAEGNTLSARRSQMPGPAHYGELIEARALTKRQYAISQQKLAC